MRSSTSCSFVVALLGAAAVRSRAQNLVETIPHAECSASDVIGYDFMAEPLDSGLSIHWSVSPFDTVSFEVMSTDSELGWMSIGFSTDGNMIGSDAIVGMGGLVLEYYLGSKTLPVYQVPTIEESIFLFPDQELANAAWERVGNNTSMSFTRPTIPAGEGKQLLFPGDPVTMIWAAGTDDTYGESIGYHFLGRGAFTVDLLCASVVATGASNAMPLTEAPSMSPRAVGFTVSPTSAPTSPLLPVPLDDGMSSGALAGLLQDGGSVFGVRSFARAMAFGLVAIGVSATSALL